MARSRLAVASLVGSSVTFLLGASASQTISFGALANKSFGAPPFPLAASASSGLPISFVSNTPKVCSVSGNTATIVAPGECSITASQTGIPPYLAATPVTQTFSVLFDDVAADANYANAVALFDQYGITNGCSVADYCPDLAVTRDEMAIFLVRAVYGGDNFTFSATPYFTDVQPSTFGSNGFRSCRNSG